MTALRFAWVGCHAEGKLAFEALLQAGAPITGVVTLSAERRARRAAAIDYGPLARRFGVPLYEVADVNGPDGLAAFHQLCPDIAFVIGWHQILQPATLARARIGMIGAHASLLPRDRGSAPINWALIRGERETGNSLIWLAEGVDQGAIIDQTAFPITPYDTCASLYQRVAASNRDMLVRLLPRLLDGERPGRPQPLGPEPVLPRRRPEDGRVDWCRPSGEVYDFIRALARPYPGAFSSLDGTRWTIWQAARLPPHAGTAQSSLPGTVLGAVVSPRAEACGQMVACGTGAGAGALVLLEVERADGTLLSGPALSEQPWTGKEWSDAGPA